jgi:hypothetical protein
LSLIGVVCVVAAMPASADHVPTAPHKPAAAKARVARPPAMKGQTVGDMPFSNPYPPPVGAGNGAGGEFPAAKTTAPIDPKGGVSFIYKWRASNEPTDPYWHVRNEYGPDGPGSTFLGGLKLGF